MKAAKTDEGARGASRVPLTAVCGERERRLPVSSLGPRQHASIRTASDRYLPPVPVLQSKVSDEAVERATASPGEAGLQTALDVLRRRMF